MMAKRQRGFSLIELISVIVIIGILATMTTDMIVKPVQGYVDLSRRATLVDVAEMALRRMQRDIRGALPQSLKLNGSSEIELLHVIDVGRYRWKPGVQNGVVSTDSLNFSIADNGFDVVGKLTGNGKVGDWLLVLNESASQSDVYSNLNRSQLSAVSATHVGFANKQFVQDSDKKRFFIVDKQIKYSCDTSAAQPKDKKLLRYDKGLNSASYSAADLLGQYLSSCIFSINGNLLVLTLVLTDEQGESVRLIQQVEMNNRL